MAELADALDSGSSPGNWVEVRVLSAASKTDEPANGGLTVAGSGFSWAATLALLLAATLWSLNGPLIKWLHGGGDVAAKDSAAGPGAGDGVGGLALAFYRSLFGGLILLPLAWPRRASVRRVAPIWPIAAAVAFAVMSATFVVANTKMPAANAILLQYTAPAWVLLLAPLILGERIARRDILIVLIAIIGLLIVVQGDTGGAVGLSFAIVSGCAYAMVIILLRKLSPVEPLVVTTTNAIGSALLLAPLVGGYGTLALSAKQAGGLALMGFGQFVLPYLIFSWALQRTTAARAALLTLLETILNPLWTYLLLGEMPPPATFVGGPLILLSVVMKVGVDARREAASRREAAR